MQNIMIVASARVKNIVLCSILLFSSSAFARDFTGTFFEGGAGVASTNVDRTETTQSGNTVLNYGKKRNSFSLRLAGGYSYTYDSGLNLGWSGWLNPLPVKWNDHDKNRFTVGAAFEPGYYFNTTGTLAYAKIGLAYSRNNLPKPYDANYISSLLGLGVKYTVDRVNYAGIEWSSYFFGKDKGNYRPSGCGDDGCSLNWKSNLRSQNNLLFTIGHYF